jgi:hypothetical protein
MQMLLKSWILLWPKIKLRRVRVASLRFRTRPSVVN